MTWRAGLALVLASLLADSVAADPQNFTLVKRGRYLVTLADCEACHDRPDSDATFAGGRSIETPFGKLRASNITPDKDTGIGAWTNDQFDDALRHGRRPDGARLYPAMPYNYYTRMSRDDANAIRAYLATVPPVRHRVESNTLPFPFRIRAVMRLWDALYQKEGQFRPDPSKSAEWNRGAFIVTGPGHCGACHAPKSLFGGDKDDEFLHGSLIQDWFAPDITNNEASGVGRWAVDDVVAYLKSGHNRVSAATGPMAEEVARASSRATDADLRAIAVYLKSLPGDTEAHPADAPTPVTTAGGAIYRDQCSACHGLEGKGVDRLFPSLADSALVRSRDPSTIIRLVLRGARSVSTAGEPTSPGMPAYGRLLNDAQVAAVLTYVRNAWNIHAAEVKTADVQRAREKLMTRSD